MTANVLKHTRFVPPTASNFGTLVGTNSESPTLTDNTDRGLTFAYGSSPAAGENIRYAVKTKPSSSNYDIIARLQFSPLAFTTYIAGLILTDGTKIIFFGVQLGGNTRYVNQWWNSQTSWNSDRIDTHDLGYEGGGEWFRIGVVSGVPTDYYVSHNGTDWVKLLSQAATGWLTYTQIGFGMDVNRSAGLFPVASTPQCFMDVMYWADADIVPGV